MEPGHHFNIGQQHWHPVMDIDDGVVGSGGQHYEPLLPLECVPKPGQIQSGLPRQSEMVFPLLAVPFVESGRRHDTPPLQQGAAEHRFLQRRLTPGVDDDPLAFEAGTPQIIEQPQ